MEDDQPQPECYRICEQETDEKSEMGCSCPYAIKHNGLYSKCVVPTEAAAEDMPSEC